MQIVDANMTPGEPAEGPRDRRTVGDGLTRLPVPTSPRSIRETGLDAALLNELALKATFLAGRTHLHVLAARLKLSVAVLNEVLAFLVAEHLVEIARRGASDMDVEYQLTALGKQRAAECMLRNRYAGPAPVTLEAYRVVVERQSVRQIRVTRADVVAAFSDCTLRQQLQDQVGAAMNSGRPLFLYGPPGSGKTFLAERLGRLLQGEVLIPHAIAVDNQIIQVFDPLVHAEVAVDPHDRPLAAASADARWALCRRPLVLTGGELTLSALDMRLDRNAGYYQAPPQFKANNGIFIVDDLGRQPMSPAALMNRWIVPLDRGCDHFSLHTGHRFQVPFDVRLVFSTNMAPHTLADESFLRRLGYKIHVGALAEDEYRAVFRHHCAETGVQFEESAFRFLVENLHARQARPMLACHPRDLLGIVIDHAKYAGLQPAMELEALQRAWFSYFAAAPSRHERSEDGTMDDRRKT